jgi:clan AA aspartic protease (TIGR02281 family)
MVLANKLLTVTSAFTALFVFTATSTAQQPISQLKTSAGLLLARPATGLACGKDLLQCTVISLDGRILFANEYIYIAKVYPSTTSPKLVIVGESDGGNTNPPRYNLIDFSTTPPILAKDIRPFAPEKLSLIENGITIEGFDGLDSLGDSLIGAYKYQWGSGRVALIRRFPRYSDTDLQGAERVLSDPIQRKPLLTLIGKDYFGEFRSHMRNSQPDELTVIGDRFVVASGCTPHACPLGAMFVIDVLKKKAWAVEREEGEAKLWGYLGSEDAVPRKMIGEWLEKHSVSWNMVSLVPPPPVSVEKEESVRNNTRLDIAPNSQNTSTSDLNASKIGVSLKSDAGIFVVPVHINGTVTLDFVVDSGASYVSIPADVFSTLNRAGTIKQNDYVGKETLVLADGTKSESTIFTIRSLKVGDIVIENVKSSVASAKGSLLLGQSFLERFKSWSIDNTKRELVLEPQ